MKKLVAVLVAIAMLVAPQAAFASTKTIKLAKFGSASIATSITLPAKNSCKEIPFKYDLSGNYSWPYAFTSFSLATRAEDMIGSVIIEAGNEYDEDGNMFDESVDDYFLPLKKLSDDLLNLTFESLVDYYLWKK